MDDQENETADSPAEVGASNKWPENEKGGRTVTLQDPFEWAGEQVTEIEVPRPMVFHMRGLNTKRLSEETDEMFKLLQKLLGVIPKYMDKLSFADSMELLGVVNDFLPSGVKNPNGVK